MSAARASFDVHGYRDRRDAGRQLGERLAALAPEHPVVIGLPRGGVPVAFEVARALDAPLDVLVARKLGAPGNPEYGVGAIAESGVRVLNEQAVRMLQLTPEELEHVTDRAERELRTRLARYREGRAPAPVKGRTAILVDDGLATGGTARAALRALRERDPARLILAVPVGAGATVQALERECDEIVCLLTPEPMWAIGSWYDDFSQTTDEEVSALLAASPPAAPLRTALAAAADPEDPPDPPPKRHETRIPAPGDAQVVGDLTVPDAASGIVVFAHGSGSSRHSPRNRDVAGALNAAGLATLLIDLHDLGDARRALADAGTVSVARSSSPAARNTRPKNSSLQETSVKLASPRPPCPPGEASTPRSPGGDRPTRGTRPGSRGWR
jgi:putative phosphoribosyl transferase